MQYSGIAGNLVFNKQSAALALGNDHAAVKSNLVGGPSGVRRWSCISAQIATVQAVSGTGALRIGAEFLVCRLPTRRAA